MNSGLSDEESLTLRRTIEQNLNEFDALSKESKALFLEAFDIVSDRSSGIGGVDRIKDIFSSNSNQDLNLNVDVHLPYGETLLYKAISHSLAMVRALIVDAAADPNVGNLVDGETALEALLDIEERTAEQQSMMELLQESGACEPSPDGAESVLDEYREKLFWSIGQDPSELEEIEKDFLGKLFVQQSLHPRIEEAAKLTPEEIEFRASFQKGLARVRKSYEKRPENTKALMNEAFQLMDIDEHDEPCYGSREEAVKRIQEILSTKGTSPNLLRLEDGQSLLYSVVANYRMMEEDEGMALELVKYLLEKEVDPNVENVLDRETALDHLDVNVELEDLTTEHAQIIEILKQAGAKILSRNDDGIVIGERGQGVGAHEHARQL
jgi:hypothetical protein